MYQIFLSFSDLGDGVLRDVCVHSHSVRLPCCHCRRQNVVPRKMGYDLASVQLDDYISCIQHTLPGYLYTQYMSCVNCCTMIVTSSSLLFLLLFILSSERFFISVCCFLTFNINDWLGRTITTLIRWVSIKIISTYESFSCILFAATKTFLDPFFVDSLFHSPVSSAASQRVPSVPGTSCLQGGVHPSADAL